MLRISKLDFNFRAFSRKNNLEAVRIAKILMIDAETSIVHPRYSIKIHVIVLSHNEAQRSD